MPQIGRIDVPEALWKELVSVCIVDFPRTILSDLGDRYDNTVDASARLKEMNSYLNDEYDRVADKLIVLIQAQTQRPNATINEIEKSEDYTEIWHAARTIGDQVSFEAMFNLENLKSLANTHVQQI